MINRRNDVRHFREILQYDTNMNLIKTWNSQKEIGMDSNYSENGINVYLKHGSKLGLYKKCIWKYGK